jgi:hypothetical protein
VPIVRGVPERFPAIEPDVPWLLHRAWPGSELHLVRTGHQGGDEMTERMMAALTRFAGREG